MADNEIKEISAKIEKAKELKALGTQLLEEGDYEAANDIV